MKMIRTYASNGRRLRDRSEESVLRLEKMGTLAVKRTRTGRISGCQFKSHLGTDPLKKSAHMGQAYSFLCQVGESTYAWCHKNMVDRQEVEALFGEVTDRKDIDRFIRGVFLAVALSVIVEQPPPPAPGRVVDIGVWRKRTALVSTGTEEKKVA